ncbi:amidohydrolase family protein [Haloferax sp. Atlit-12N]|uniref:metal-dependent hydrolase family protein n=1 Tax=Haloferax sp. Atlit-12N TaxID=2077203 RepID=UPI000E238848|nr:amidohydrolase family protein [Haloferax sp. Atlit-12N]RDZ64302.1 amidohydrolase family protein [Haloferax sp. Atlit-12N]
MLLRGARVIRGDRVVEETDVRTDAETGRIEAVGDLDPRGDERVADLAGKTVTPGLVDAHIHFSLSGERSVEDVVGMSDAELTLVEARNARKTLEAGVTGARVMGARDIDVALKRAIDAGDVPGPRTVANCRSITITGGHGHHMGREIDGPTEARKAVREQVKLGADFIKFMTTGGVTTPGSDPSAVAFTEEELHALVDEAHRRGVHTATHAHGGEGVKAAIRAGVDTVEHGTFLDDEAIDLFLERDATLVPTLSAPYHIVRNTEAATKEDVTKTEFVYDRHIESFKLAAEAGVRIAGGTDAGTPFNVHGGNASEVQFMAQHAMEPLDAIRAMTETAADAVGLDDCGVVEPGAYADLLVFDDDPLSDLTVLNDPTAVLKGGRVVAGAVPGAVSGGE